MSRPPDGLVRTIRLLWRRRRLLALGVAVALLAALFSVYRISLLPPTLESRTNVFATASTQVLVDTPGSAFADLASDLDPLDTRAGVFARFLASPAAIAMIARRAELPVEGIEAQGPFELNQPLFEQEPTAEKRSSQILGERALYRLRFDHNPDLPIISVFAQAPTADDAIRLAAAAPAALRSYIAELQRRQHTPPWRRVEIRRLGSATGGVVNRHANLQIGLLVFLGVMVGWCMLLIPAETIARGWRQSEDPGDLAAVGNGNGAAQGRRGGGRGSPWRDGGHDRVR